MSEIRTKVCHPCEYKKSLAVWLTQTEWHVPWRRRSWSRHHQWCTQLRCCPAGRDPLDLSSAVRTTFLNTAMKTKKVQNYFIYFFTCFLQHACCLCVSFHSPSWGQSPVWLWSCQQHRRQTDSAPRRTAGPAAGPPYRIPFYNEHTYQCIRTRNRLCVAEYKFKYINIIIWHCMFGTN